MKPTAAQLKAIEKFSRIEGRQWKQALRDAWMNGDYGIHGDISTDLQQLRNTLGPAWLNRFNLSSLRPFAKVTYRDMSDTVRAIRKELKHRNPIGVNMYVPYLEAAAAALDEISGGEADNFTSESGPKEPNR